MNVPDYLHPLIQEAIGMESDGAHKRRLWAVILGLKPQLDGDHWCILWGEDLQSGIAGFGKTPVDAINAFEDAMYESIKSVKKK